MIRRIPLVLAVLLLAPPARGERPHAALTLDYAPGQSAARCPKEKLLHDEIARRIGYDPFDSRSRAQLTITIEREKQAYRVTGKIRDEGRETFTDAFTDPDCASAVTMMARALAADLTTVPDSPPSPAPVPDSAPVIAPPPPPAPLPEQTRIRAGAGAALAFNLAPAVLTGPVVAAGMRYSYLSAALEGRALFGPRVDVGGVGVVSSYYAGSIGACGHYAVLFGCGRVELGALRFQPPEGVKRAPVDLFVAGVGLRIGAEGFVAEHVVLNGYADLRVEMTNPIELRSAVDHRVAWSSSRPSPGVGLGIAVSY